MRLVADSNVLFTFFWKNSALDGIMRQNARLFSPEHSLEEIGKHRRGIIEKTGLTENEFDGLLLQMKSVVEFVPRSSYEKHLAEVEQLANDFPDSEKASFLEDWDFLALALLLHCPLWSNDKQLKKQATITVFSTQEVIMLFAPKEPGTSWGSMLAWMKEKDKHFKGKLEKTDHDLIAHGVNRDGDVLLPSGRILRKRKQ